MKPLSKDDGIYWMIPQSNGTLKKDSLRWIEALAFRSALAWAKSWRYYAAGVCEDCNKIAPLFYEFPIKIKLVCKDCLLSRAFGEAMRK